MDVRLLWTIARTESSFRDTTHNKYCMGDLSFMEKHSADKKTLILPLIDVQDLHNRSSGSSKWCFASLNLCFRAQDLCCRALIPLLCTENLWCFMTASAGLAQAFNGAGKIYGVWTPFSFNVSPDSPIPWLSWWYWFIGFDPDCAAYHWGSTLNRGGPLPLETLQHDKSVKKRWTEQWTQGELNGGAAVAETTVLCKQTMKMQWSGGVHG